MKTYPRKVILAATGLLLLPLTSHAAVIISQFNFTGDSAASSDSEPITTTSNITQGAGISGSIIANDRLEVRGNQTTASNSNNTLASQQPPAITANEYITFTVTVPTGQVMSLTALDYSWATQNAYRQSFGIYSDKTGFTYANILDGLHQSGGSGTGGSMTGFTGRSIDLSGIASLQDLSDTTVEFRFYITHPQSSSNLRAWAFDDIVLNGTVDVIPEPTDGHPVILYIISKNHQPGPGGNPRMWKIARWNGSEWLFHEITTALHNYDMGSLYIEENGSWKIIAPIGAGPQHWGTGGEIEIWTSNDQGATWKKQRAVTANSERNHSYARRPRNAHPDFHTYWADGNADELSESHLWFTNQAGDKLWRLPYTMTEDYAAPELVNP